MNHRGSTRTQNTAHEAADLHLGRQFVPLVLPVAHSMSPGRLQLNSIPTTPEARESVNKIDADRLSGAHTHRPETLLPFSCFQGRLQPDVICSDCRSPTETVLSPHLDISTKRLQNQRSLSRLCIGAAFRWPERVWMKPCSPSLCSFFPQTKLCCFVVLQHRAHVVSYSRHRRYIITYGYIPLWESDVSQKAPASASGHMLEVRSIWAEGVFYYRVQHATK